MSQNSTMASDPVVNRTSFEDMLAEEVNFTPARNQSKHLTFQDTMGGVTPSTPNRKQEDVVLPSRPTEQSHPEEISFHAAAHKIRKMWEPKISKLKGRYSSSIGLIFQSWLKDIHVHVEDRRLTHRGTIQLVKDFTTEHAQDEVEFYMGMVATENQSFKGLIGIIGWNLIWFTYKVFINKYGEGKLNSFDCLAGVNPLLFSQLCLYYYAEISKEHDYGVQSIYHHTDKDVVSPKNWLPWLKEVQPSFIRNDGL